MNRILLSCLVWAVSSIALLPADDVAATSAPATNAPVEDAPATNSPVAGAPSTNAPPAAPQDEVDAEVAKARALLNAKKSMDALPIAMALMKTHRKDARAWSCLGEVDVALNLTTDATNAMVKATQLDPTNYEAWYILGDCYYQVGDWDNAIAADTKAIDLKPDVAGSWTTLMGLYLKIRKDPIAFRAKVQELLVAHPKSSAGWAVLAMVDIELQAKEEARMALDKASGLNTTDGYLSTRMIGPSYSKVGDLNDAAAEIRKGLKLVPNDVESWNNLGYTLALQDKLDEAIESYNKAVAIDPTYFRTYYNLTAAYQKQQKWDLARDNWRKLAKYNEDQAAELTPNFPVDQPATLTPAPPQTTIVIPAQ